MTALPPAISPNDQEFVRQLLAESGVDTSLPLQGSLLELRASGTLPAPAASAELAAFMAPAAVPLRRTRRPFRGAAIGLAIAAATGLGVSGVAAANPQFQAAADQTVRRIVGFIAPAAGPTSAPEEQPLEPASGTGPAETVRPAPESTGSKPARTPSPAATDGPGGAATVPTDKPAGTGRAEPRPRATPQPSGSGLPPTSLPTDLPVHGSKEPVDAGLQVPDPADLPTLPALPGVPKQVDPDTAR